MGNPIEFTAECTHATAEHFWLDPQQQALMNSATSTASSFGYIGLFCVGKAWKRRVTEMAGTPVGKENYLRAHNLAGTCYFGRRPYQEVRGIIRLSRQQALMMKLRVSGSDGWVVEDVTGESWGNMLICAGRLGFHRYQARQAMNALLEGNSFGPTLDTVRDLPFSLEEKLRPSFVWFRAGEWHEANQVLVEQVYSASSNEANIVRHSNNLEAWLFAYRKLSEPIGDIEEFRLQMNELFCWPKRRSITSGLERLSPPSCARVGEEL